MKMYDDYDLCRDQPNRLYDCNETSHMLSYLLTTSLLQDSSTNSSNDYMREFQGSINGLDSTATSKQLKFKTEPDEDSEEFKNKHQRDWTRSDVLHWIASVAKMQRFPYESVNANAFNVDGRTLLNYSKKDFMNIDETYGEVLHDALHKSLPRFEEIQTPFQPPSQAKKESNLETLSTPATIAQFQFASKNIRDSTTPYGLVNEPFQNEYNNSSEAYPFELDPVTSDQEKPPDAYGAASQRKISSEASLSSDTEQSDLEVKEEHKKAVVPVKRPPGRPPGVKTKKEKPEKKTGRLWEFIRDLLLDPQHCPSVICWENHDDGVFRFVKSDKVAKIWGDRKGNEKMNYEKLSRAMRYYYRSQVLQPVIGRRLVYKFGPTARGWKTNNPNFRH